MDFRNVKSPKISEGQIDFYLSGDLLYKGEECSIQPDNLDFIDSNQTVSQIVVSESTATCFANQLAKSKIGKVSLNKDKVNKFWGTGNALNFNTSSLSPHLPLFQKKLGDNKPLKVDLNMRDFKVQFGKMGTDVIMQYTLGVAVALDQANSETLFYDEFKMLSTANVRAADDIVYIALQTNKLDIDADKGHQTKPMMDKMNITTAEYREFVSSFGFYANFLKKYLNNVYFKNGIRFPYNPKEIYTTLKFKEQSAHIFLTLNEDADKFFED